MKAFLEHIAAYLIQQHPKDLKDVCVVVPNIRAGLFLKNYLSAQSEQAIWAPEILSIQDFISRQSGLEAEEQLPLLLRLYEAFKTHDPKTESFDTFYPWCEVVLNDFNDIDKNLVEAGQIFQNVRDLKEIEMRFSGLEDSAVERIRSFWHNFQPEKESAVKDRFLKLWESMPQVYELFCKSLKDEGLAYAGLMYKEALTKLSGKIFAAPQPKHYFAGFNVLSTAEEHIFRYFKNQHNAGFFWQYPASLENLEGHEAIRFIKKYVRDFPHPEGFSYRAPEKIHANIRSYAIPSRTAQAKLAGDMLDNQIALTGEFDDTAIVLGDESLMQAVLFSIPESVENLNISMGFPLKYAPVNSLMRDLSDMQNTYADKQSFYHKHVVSILQHPLIVEIIGEEARQLREIIIKENRLRLKEDFFDANKKLKQIFRYAGDVKTLGKYFEHVLHMLYDSLREKDGMEFERESIYLAFRTVLRFNEMLVKKPNLITTHNTYLHFFRRMCDLLSIPFSSEPLKGLQVMGLLETRLLDFKKLIILSMNEGILPKKRANPSMIPFTLREAFGMPTIRHQDSIYSYYFYRLLMHADEVHLVMNNSLADQDSEESRLIKQLRYEQSLIDKTENVSFITRMPRTEPIIVEKDAALMDRLEEQIHKPFSPTRINTWLNCSLRYYFRYIIGLDETEELSEEIGHMDIGNLFHYSINRLYENFRGSVVSEDMLKVLGRQETDIRNIMHEVFKSELSPYMQHDRGINSLIYQLVFDFLKHQLNWDREHPGFTYEGGELEVERELDIRFRGSEHKLKIRGSIDRMDQYQDAWRIIDYKTGSEKNTFKSLDALFDENRENKLDHVFQILCYSWMALPGKVRDSNLDVRPALFYVSRANGNLFLKNRNKAYTDFRPDEAEFENMLRDNLEKLFHPDIPFRATHNDKNCEYCPFRGLCY